MSTIFTKIINREIPGNFVYEDEKCVVFATIEPISPGHVLVVPREEVDNFVDADPALISHLFQVAQKIGQAATKAFAKERAGILVAGFDVPHLHIHVVPANSAAEMDISRAAAAPQEEIAAAMDRLRAAL